MYVYRVNPRMHVHVCICIHFFFSLSLLNLQHDFHVGLYLRVDGGLVGLWDHEEVDRLGRAGQRALEVLVDVLGEEGRQRSHHAAQHHHHLVPGGGAQPRVDD